MEAGSKTEGENQEKTEVGGLRSEIGCRRSAAYATLRRAKEVAPVEFSWGNPIQLGKEVGGLRANYGGQKSEVKSRKSRDGYGKKTDKIRKGLESL